MITANITLKSESGASIFDKGALVTSENVMQYMPSKSTFQKAKKLLQSDGFEVIVNGTGFNVNTSKKNFEKVFNVKLIESKSQNQAVYTTDKKIAVPINWKALIESIDLPEPVEYY